MKTRFAPSPTGQLHLGNVRTALYNALMARHENGVFLLRLEDTDAERSRDEFIGMLMQDLSWLGLPWQEGPEVGGAHGPYRQSERRAIYDEYFDRLQADGQAYPCFCSGQELKLSRKALQSAGKPPRYSGKCVHLTADEVTKYRVEGRKATLRFRVPRKEVIVFDDKVRGEQKFDSEDIGDFIIRRSDGTPAFFFSNAVDDALMEVSLVVRGEDHLTNTPRQMMLLRALGLRVPDYAHIALVVGDDGAPLSKRHGSRTVASLREEGYLPLAICNYLARLGHHYESNDHMSMDELAAAMVTEHMHRAPARFDAAQLFHWQKEAVMHATDQELWHSWSAWRDEAGRSLSKIIDDAKSLGFVKAVRDNVVLPADAMRLAIQLTDNDVVFSADAENTIQQAGREFFGIALNELQKNHEDFKSYARAVGEAVGVKGKGLYMPLRAALTGEVHGPEMAQIWNLLGRERIKQRIQSQS